MRKCSKALGALSCWAASWGVVALTQTSCGDDDVTNPPAVQSSYAPIKERGVTTLTQVHDLRGLVFTKRGAIYASGHTNGDDRHLAVVKLTSSGALDASFGQGGIVSLNLSPLGDEQSIGIVELANGDLIVQANISDGKGGEPLTDSAGGPSTPRPSGTDVVLVRLSPQGDKVPSFGEQGVARVDFGWSAEHDAAWPVPTYNSARGENALLGTGYPVDVSWGIGLDSRDGVERIVVFGHGPAAHSQEALRFDNDRYVARILASNGKADPDFNNGEAFGLDTGAKLSDGARRGLVEADGSILSTGYTNFGDNLGNHAVLIRLQADGTPDVNFGFGSSLPGTAVFNPFVDDGGFSECYAAGKLSTGAYVTTGYGRATGAGRDSSFGYQSTDSVDVVSFAVNPRGLDSNYGRKGALAMQSEGLGLPSTEERGRMLVVLPDDRVVHVGKFGGSPAIYVTLPNGALDAKQGNAGIFTYDFAPIKGHFFAAALSPDGKHVVAATNNDDAGVAVVVLEIGAQ